MKVLVLSDSHGRNAEMNKVVNIVKPDVLIHLGDGFSDVGITAAPIIYAVRGNCDYGGAEKDEKVVEIEDKRFFLCHGHTRGVKSSYDRLLYAALERDADVCLFGHTHMPELFEEDGVIVMNPGSIGAPRGTLPSYGIVDIDGGAVTASVISAVGGGVYRIMRQIEAGGAIE